MSRVSLCGFIDCWLCGFTIVSADESEPSKRDPQSDLTSRYFQSVPNAFVTRPTVASIAMAAGWAGARCFCCCGPAGQGLVRGRPCGLRHNFFAPKTAPGKNFQKCFRRFSEVFQRRAGISKSRACMKHLNNSHFPEAFQSIFREFPRGHKSVFSGGGILRFPKRSGRVSLGFRFDPPWLFNVISNAGPCVVINGTQDAHMKPSAKF